MEEDTELRDLVVQTLENNGVLAKIRVCSGSGEKKMCREKNAGFFRLDAFSIGENKRMKNANAVKTFLSSSLRVIETFLVMFTGGTQSECVPGVGRAGFGDGKVLFERTAYAKKELSVYIVFFLSD